MRDQYKCHECSIGQCYSVYGNEEYSYCQNKPFWRALTEQIGRGN
jgi:hypothetical protein